MLATCNVCYSFAAGSPPKCALTGGCCALQTDSQTDATDTPTHTFRYKKEDLTNDEIVLRSLRLIESLLKRNRVHVPLLTYAASYECIWDRSMHVFGTDPCMYLGQIHACALLPVALDSRLSEK
jgi:hypothetical protein